VIHEPFPSQRPVDKSERWLKIRGKGSWILTCHSSYDCNDYPDTRTFNKDVVPSLTIQLSNNLVQNKDFTVAYFDNNTIPYRFQYQKSREIIVLSTRIINTQLNTTI
jgi:hypothetical protein